ARRPARAAEDAGYDRCMALALIDPERGVAEARRWREEGGGDAAAHCEAIAYLRAGEGTRAADLLEELGQNGLAPRDARAALLAQAGQIWLEQGALDRAYGAATLALVLRPEDPDLLTDRAVIAASAGRFEEAIDDLTRVVDLRPYRADAYVLRASAWRQLGQPALARDDIARALERDGMNQEAWLESGLLRHAANDLPGARRDWEQAIRIAPETATAALAARNIARMSEAPSQAPAAAAAPPRGGEPVIPRPPPSPPAAPRR
ncbi:tetratricopeptide repeat protein, partial [Elioraea rosea]|uniref:tetratricopeptide repeat protein n=1 Tax=Elioraea rosea TaxID=2492390 RepID=UPI0011846D88